MKTLKIGDNAPSFTCKDQDENLVKLTDFVGKKVVLFFYPKANTPGCTAEACDLRDHHSQFVNKNYVLIGVSADTSKSQKKFEEKYTLPFSLLADEDKTIIQAYGVWGPKKFMGKVYDGIHRTTFVIDEKGVIEKIISEVKTKAHASQILEKF